MKNLEWIGSVRSLITLEIATTFCYMAYLGKIEAKDFMLITSLVMNFYFLAKARLPEQNGGTDGQK